MRAAAAGSMWRIGVQAPSTYGGSAPGLGALPDAAAPCPGCWSRQVYRSREVSRPPLRLASQKCIKMKHTKLYKQYYIKCITLKTNLDRSLRLTYKWLQLASS
jgi:hypothetical protein